MNPLISVIACFVATALVTILLLIDNARTRSYVRRNILSNTRVTNAMMEHREELKQFLKEKNQ